MLSKDPVVLRTVLEQGARILRSGRFQVQSSTINAFYVSVSSLQPNPCNIFSSQEVDQGAVCVDLMMLDDLIEESKKEQKKLTPQDDRLTCVLGYQK